MLWTHRPLPGKLSTLSQGTYPARGRKCWDKTPCLFPLLYCLVPAFVQLSRLGEGTEREGKDGQAEREEIGPPMEMQGAEKARKSQEGVAAEEENNSNKLGD